MRLVNFLVFMSILLFISCNCDCPEGYECAEKSCFCPEDKFEGYGECRYLAENEYYATIDCIYKDTLFTTFVAKNDGWYDIKLTLDAGNTITTVAQFKELSGYDSIFFYHALGLRKFGAGGLVDASIFGRLYPEKFEGRIEWRSHVNGELADVCPFEMVR